MKTETTFAGTTTKAGETRSIWRVLILLAAMIMLIPAKTYAGDIQSSMIELRDHLGIDENNGSATSTFDAVKDIGSAFDYKTFKFAVAE